MIYDGICQDLSLSMAGRVMGEFTPVKPVGLVLTPYDCVTTRSTCGIHERA
ncbi:hypothetical protein HanRHA438_Chr11g0502511 [Helianthus annuus]|nr:hypothetical protein HanRHA438_Chr11g0502511 [Helianthus annuus]